MPRTVTPLQTTSGTNLDARTLQSLSDGKYSVATGTTMRLGCRLQLSSLNGAAAVFTVKLRDTTNSRTLYQAVEAKDIATDTGIVITIPQLWCVGGAAAVIDYTVQVLSSNASDTAIAWTLDWFDAIPADADNAGIKTALEADGSKLDHLWEMTEDEEGTRRLTAEALGAAPAPDASAIALAVLTADVAGAIEDAAAEHSLCYVILAAAQADTTSHAGKLTVFKADGETEFVQKDITTTSASTAITQIG
jgi:hypothetical protein